LYISVLVPLKVVAVQVRLQGGLQGSVPKDGSLVIVLREKQKQNWLPASGSRDKVERMARTFLLQKLQPRLVVSESNYLSSG
jgi:hypothetical protein